ncbi:MAG: dynamin family protein [Methanomicrobiales archaeon]|nr:dynamin family protein [Methanomicrobiales archaeon]
MRDPSRPTILTAEAHPDSRPTAPSIHRSEAFEPNPVTTVIPALIAGLRALGPEYSPHAERLQLLRDRLVEGRFHLAVLGQFKRGKSTLLNALLGEAVLPSSVIPVTAIPTFIQYGERKRVVIHFQDGRADVTHEADDAAELNRLLGRYVSEDGNPRNTLGVTQADVFHPAPLLRDVVLIDTPGIGSTHRHNTEVTLNFLSQCDAALFLVSSDPPITEVEVEFLRQVRERVARLFFILNKVDYLDDAERATAIAFLQKVLAQGAGDARDPIIFAVSARQGLAARERRDAALWEASGLAAVSDHLVNFLAREKSAVLQQAVRSKAVAILNDARLQVQLGIRSLELPLADVEQRLAIFEQKIQEAERQRLHARDILAGDQNRIAEHLESFAAALRTTTREQLLEIADKALQKSLDEQAAQDAVAAAIPELYGEKLAEVDAAMNQELVRLLKSHQRRADDLIESIRVTAAELFEIPYHAPESEQAFEMQRRPYWVAQKTWNSTFNPIPNEFIDRLTPRPMRERRIRERLQRRIEHLVIQNVENLRWETLQNLNISFLHYGTALDRDLRDTIEATHGAIRAACEKRREHVEETAAELARLRSAERDVHAALQALGEP